MAIRVVLADDQALVRAGFHALLDRTEDIEVVGEAADGAAAIGIARDCRPGAPLTERDTAGDRRIL